MAKPIEWKIEANAVCIKCGKDAPVCCDSRINDDGTHEDPVCVECCGPHPFPLFGPGYERMDCDK